MGENECFGRDGKSESPLIFVLCSRTISVHALTDNCTTTIRYHARHVAPVQRLNWKILANGHLDELLYERGRVDTSLPFTELRQHSEITTKAKAAAGSPDFARLIRVGLPMPVP